MTTTTDPDVEVRNADTGQVYPSQVLNEVARLDGAATDADLQALLQHNHDLRADLERTRAELAALRATVSPLEAGWIPPTEKPTAWIEEQTIAHRAAEHRSTADTHSYIADLHKLDRQRWESLADDIEALSAHEPADVWDDALRALTAEPVAVDYSYRQSEAWALADMVVGQSRQQSVYDQLAPENIQNGPDEPPGKRQPEDRAALDKLTKRVPTAISAQSANSDNDAGTTPPAPEPEGTVRASWWARLAAWFGGATTRRRQTEQDGGA